MSEHVDVLIVGAGLSGIGAACHLEERLPGTTYAVLEARDAIGGTWDLFRYPGIRSDSDMYTLGYRFRPWTGEKAIADGPSILAYVRETAAAYGVEEKVRYGAKVVAAVVVERRRDLDGDGWRTAARPTCGFLWCCSGYYDYDGGYSPDFAGLEDFAGRGGAPAAVARGPGVRRQAGRRDRQWRDRRDAGAGDGREGRARDDAAALAHLHRLAAGRRQDRDQAAREAAARPGLRGSPAGRTCSTRPRPTSSPGAGPS